VLGVWVGLLCAVTWAGSSIMLKDLARKLDPFTLNAPRTLAGGLMMFLLTLATGRTSQYQMVTGDRLVFVLASVLVGGGLGDACYILSIKRIGVSRAFPISSTYPVLTLVLGVLFLQESVDWSVVLGFALVLPCILLISGWRLQSTAEKEPLMASGVVLSLAASVCWAVGMILLAPGIKGLDSVMVASFRTPALSLVLWSIVAARGTYGTLRELSRREWLVLILGGILGWGLGSVLFLLAVDLAGTARAAILTSTSPLFVLPLSMIFLKERITRQVLVGTALTVTGIILVS
jgi:drug/metabolite transporter (DMT)-like permease